MATPSSTTRTRVRIFVASPEDVNDERNRLDAVVTGLNRGFADDLGLTLDLQSESHLTPGGGKTQDAIKEQIPPDTWDIFVAIFWRRFGMATVDIDPDTEQAYNSSVEHMFKIAYRLYQKNKTGWPKIMVYWSTRVGS
jgi:hypothetical protein